MGTNVGKKVGWVMGFNDLGEIFLGFVYAANLKYDWDWRY